MTRRGRSEQAQVFQDIVRSDAARFDLPDLKFRELVFIGSIRALAEAPDVFVRDPSRPIPLFREPDLISEGARFRVTRRGGRAFFERL